MPLAQILYTAYTKSICVKRMMHRKYLIGSIWAIAVGTVLAYIGTELWKMVQWLTIGYYIAVGLTWGGGAVIVFGVFGLISTAILEYLDRKSSSITK